MFSKIDRPSMTWAGVGAAHLFLFPIICFSNNWTHFQCGLSSNTGKYQFPMTWSATENVAWKTNITGYGQSSPVSYDNSLYLTSISGEKKETCHVTALDIVTGQQLWQYQLPAATQTENSNYVSKAAPTPVVDGNGVYCFFEGGNLLSLTHQGTIRWKRNLVEEFGSIQSRHGLAASLEQLDDRIFVWVERQENPYILAVDKASGKVLWKSPGIGATSWASPRLIPVDGGTHLVLSGIGIVAGLDPMTGKLLWRMTGISGNSAPTPVPAGRGRFLLGATQGRGDTDSGKAAESNGLVDIRKSSDASYQAEFVWRSKRATSSFGSPAVHGEHAYFVNATGVLFCLDLKTGEEKYTHRMPDSTWATPLALEDRILFLEKGELQQSLQVAPHSNRSQKTHPKQR